MSKLSKIAKNVVAVGNYTPLNDIIINYPNGVVINGITVKAAKNQPRAIALLYNKVFSYVFNLNATDRENLLNNLEKANSDTDTDTGSDIDADTGSDIDTDTGSDTDNKGEYYFYAESGDLKKIVTAWLDEMTIDEINDELRKNPVVIKIYKMQTRNGRDYVKAEIIENDNDAGNGSDNNDAGNGSDNND